MRALTSLFCLTLLSMSACAANSGPTLAPNDYANDYVGGVAEADASMAGPAPASAPAPARDASAPGLGTAGVFASPAPAVAADDPGEQAIAELETVGADSVEQMLIFTGQLSLQVEFGETAETIDAAVGLAVAAGGYVAELTDTSLRLRVPSKRFRKLMTQIEGLGEVQSRGVTALDVSEEFHDLEVQLANLEATRARIEKLLGQTKDLNQILTIEKELQRVTSEIDRLEGRMRLLSSQAAFSTLSLAIRERAKQQQELEIATEPPPPPRTLSSSASWMSEVGIDGLMNLSE